MARAKWSYRRDSAGIREVLKLMRPEVEHAAKEIANNAQQAPEIADRGLEVTVTPYTTDRAAAAVTIASAAGLPIEGKHGTLAHAAREAGYAVKRREPRE